MNSTTNSNMERPIGSVYYDAQISRLLRVEETPIGECIGCVFLMKGNGQCMKPKYAGECSLNRRKDKCSVIFRDAVPVQRMEERQFHTQCAIAAMQGIQESGKLGEVAELTPHLIAERAFKIADAMLDEYRKRKEAK